MEEVSKKRFRVGLVAAVIMALILTNLGTYLIFGGGGRIAARDLVPQTIVRYQPRDDEDDLAVLWEAVEAIQGSYYHPVEREALVEGALRGMVRSLEDTNSRYYNTEELEEFLLDTRGSYGGIGVRIIEANRFIVVFETFPGTPAERAGLNPGDRILEADGHPLTGEGMNRAVELLRGPGDTKVDIVISRPGSEDPLELTVDREEINVTTVSAEMLGNGIGYIRIRNFDSNTAAEFREHFSILEREGLDKGLILDVRTNPGGLVDQTVAIAELLVPEGEIVRLVGQDGVVQRIYHSSADPLPYPLVVLINEETASSSELIAGALQDRGAAVLVGNKTYGKASVQQMERLSDGSAFMLTVAQYYTPSGVNIDEDGIEPDFTVEMPEVLRYYRYFHPGLLEREDYGPEVDILQQMLSQLDYPVDNSGFFDEATEEALAAFQAEQGLPPGGRFDESTWQKLRAALDQAARDEDEQLNFALDLFDKPGLWNIIGEREQP